MLWPWLIFVIVVGACVGSFLNVVIHRVPEGISIVTPPSRCPKCEALLAWYDNVPVLGWLWLRGRCRYCKTRISIQYPLIEALTAAIFGGLFAGYYMTHLRPALAEVGLPTTWPLLLTHLALLAALLAATVIDARLYIIPLPIAWTATAVALVILPATTALGWLTPAVWHPSTGAFPVRIMEPTMVGAQGVGVGVGAAAGLAVALVLLRARLLPRSFEELEEHLENTDPSDAPTAPDAFLDYPHARREVLKELGFVAPPVVGALIGGWLGAGFRGSPPSAVGVLGGVLCGCFAGAALIWGTRILGTLAFGREAMGLGDVHLLAAIGAAMGPAEAVCVFFAAPFLGLAAAMISAGVAAIIKGRVRMIPYGPYLAAAALVVMLARPWFLTLTQPFFVILGR